MRLMEHGTRVTNAAGWLGTVAGTYNEDEVLVRWDDLDGLSYEYASDLVVAEDGGHDGPGAGGEAHANVAGSSPDG
jgi:hypothetical protein